MPLFFGREAPRIRDARLDRLDRIEAQLADQSHRIEQTDTAARVATERLGDLKLDMTHGFHQQGEQFRDLRVYLTTELGAIREQTTKTNGHVNELRQWRSSVEGREQGEVKAEELGERREENIRRRRHVRVSTMLAVAAAVGTFCGGVGTLLAIILH